MSKQIGLYIHIPFCKSKCNYCDFNSYPRKEAYIEPYFDALEKEIAIRSKSLSTFTIGTIFIGGGTPSIVDAEYICRLLGKCAQYFNIAPDAEISIESNPGTLSFDKLKSYKTNGINRLSIGLQAWQDKILMGLGRIHSRSDFLESLELALRVGFININIDLIFGLPGQNLSDWTETIINVSELDITHISCYSLKIEDGTVFGEKLRTGMLQHVDEELDREMYTTAISELRKHGFIHYEISNFAKHGFECKHNIIYWKAEEYLGVGAGAHSYFEKRRSNNKYGIEDYIQAVSKQYDLAVLQSNLQKSIGVRCSQDFYFKENVQIIDKPESMSEYMILGLRLIEGVSAVEFRSRYGEDMYDVFEKQISKNLDKQLLMRENERIKLTGYGLDIANCVFSDFV